jgi:hypothetical protein
LWNAHPYSAARSTSSSGLPRVDETSTGVTVARASAIDVRVLAAACGHFRSTNITARS